MTFVVDALRHEAEVAVAAMRKTAIAARNAHARAELMRHMLATAHKMDGKSRDEAIAMIVHEWMSAWYLAPAEWPHLTREIEGLTAAFVDFVRKPDARTDTAIREGISGLETALAAQSTSIADQMAWRSQCAHGWWAMVTPVPDDLPGRKDRPTIPRYDAARPFWETGCADFCR